MTALEVEPEEAVVINSFSKLFRMPGWRIGWLVAPMSCMAALHSHLINFFLTPPAIAQHAALAASTISGSSSARSTRMPPTVLVPRSAAPWG